MEQSGVVGLTVEGNPVRITDFRDAPFCTQLVLAEMLGIDDITESIFTGRAEKNAGGGTSHLR